MAGQITGSHVAIVGSGNWGSAVARRVGMNLQDQTTDVKETHVKMWVFEELVNGRKISEIINTDHENVKYLPGVKLPTNVIACTDLFETVNGARILLFVVPHQFLLSVLRQLKGRVPKNAICVSLIKGVEFGHNGLQRYSEIIKSELGVDHVAVMMGANVANDVAKDNFAETTVGCADLSVAEKIATLFDCDTFQVDVTDDISTVELLGALKNIIALGAGFCDGLGYGASTKAALIRQGLIEMNDFCQAFGDRSHFKPHTVLGSCGVADLIATCYGGRNRRCAAEFAKTRLTGDASLPLSAEEACGRWTRLEADLLAGQKLQGVATCQEVVRFLADSGFLAQHPDAFPLMRRIYAIACQGLPVETLLPRDNSADHRSHIREI